MLIFLPFFLINSRVKNGVHVTRMFDLLTLTSKSTLFSVYQGTAIIQCSVYFSFFQEDTLL